MPGSRSVNLASARRRSPRAAAPSARSAARAPGPPSVPSSASSRFVLRDARLPCVVKRSTAPLSMIARWNSPLALGHRHQRRDFSAAARLPEDRDEIRIAAEAVDVVAHPLERRDDVEHAGAAGQREVGSHRLAEIGVAEHVQPVIDASRPRRRACARGWCRRECGRSRSRSRSRRRAATPSPAVCVRRSSQA